MLKMQTASEEETTVVAPLLSTPKAEARRYDPKTIEKAVAMAAMMQAEHQESLSSEELEAIASEAGISPEFMRRALSLLEEGETPVQTTPVAVKRTVRSRRTAGLQRLTARQKKLIFGFPLLYAAGAFLPLAVAFSWLQHGPQNPGLSLAILFGLMLPALLAVTLGANLSRKRQGAVAGAITGASAALAGILAALTFANQGGDFNGVTASLLLLTGGGAFLGFMAAWLKQAMPLWLGAAPADFADEEAETA